MPLNRSYRLTISKPPEINSDRKVITPEEGSVQVVTSQQDFRTVNRIDAITITELQITGTAGSGKEQSASGCKIDVYGLSSNSLSYIQEGSILILEMGYEDQAQLPVVFAGQVKSADVDTDDNITRAKINATEGYSPSSVKISKEYPAGVSYLQILEDLATEFGRNGIPLGRPIGSLASLQGVGVDSPVDSIILSDGFSLAGFLDTCLKKVCDEVGFTYYITNARLFIEPKNYQQFTRLFTISNNSILSIQQSVTKNISKASVDTQDTKNIYKLKTFLDGRLESGNFIQLDIPNGVSGRFKVIDVKHQFDFEGDQWFSVVEIQNA